MRIVKCGGLVKTNLCGRPQANKKIHTHIYIVYVSFPLLELIKASKLTKAKSKRMKKLLKVQI